MAIKVVGFGRQVDTKDVKPGDLAILESGERIFIALRIAYSGGEPFDLALAQLAGPALSKPLPHIRNAGHGDYFTVPGAIVARPSSEMAPMPGGIGPGALVIDSNNAAFVRSEADGVAYCALETGAEGKPHGERAFYGQWELVQIISETERVILKMDSSRSSRD